LQTSPLRPIRWRGNLLLVIFAALLVRLIMPLGLSAFAWSLQQGNDSLLKLSALPLWVALPIGLIILDLVIYWQHRLFHKVPILWRLHRVHHSDQFFDVSTALRFHPLEILLSFMIKALVVYSFGISAASIIIFEILLNAVAMFNHGNFTLPHKLERRLRRLLVTPNMHRIHHSVHMHEHHHNFAFNLSLWDRLFNSYLAKPKNEQAPIQIGLLAYQQGSTDNQGLINLLKMPFKKAAN